MRPWSASAKLRWQQVMADYLAQRRDLAGVVMMVDSRLGFTPLDQQSAGFRSRRAWAPARSSCWCC
jgi:GTP-binding protein